MLGSWVAPHPAEQPGLIHIAEQGFKRASTTREEAFETQPQSGRLSLSPHSTAKASHKPSLDLMVDKETFLLRGGAAKSYCKGNEYREGECLCYFCNQSTTLWLIHAKMPLEGIFTRKTSSMGEVMVLTLDIIKTSFFLFFKPHQRKMTQLPLRKTIAKVTLLVILCPVSAEVIAET